MYIRQDFDKEKERRDKKERDLNEQCQQMRDRAAELQDVIDKLHVSIKVIHSTQVVESVFLYYMQIPSRFLHNSLCLN